MISRRWAVSCMLIFTTAVPLAAQSVISVRSGLIHFSEGSVSLDNQALEHRFGKFDQMQDGSELRTESGRAEVLLTPGAFLRMGENSALRMVSNRLADTQIALLHGSAVLDSMAATAGAPITILYGDYQVRVQKPGRYRLNSQPPALAVEEGEASVLLGSEAELAVAGQRVPFLGPLSLEQLGNSGSDPLGNWNKARNDSISGENLASGTADLASVLDDWARDPAALLRALEAGYGPLLSRPSSSSSYSPLSTYTPRSTYSPLSTYTPYSTYSPLLGVPGVGVAPFGVWGLGFGSPLYLYTPTYLRPYSPIRPSYPVPLVTGRPGIGVSPSYQPGIRPPGLPASAVQGGAGRIGGRR